MNALQQNPLAALQAELQGELSEAELQAFREKATPFTITISGTNFEPVEYCTLATDSVAATLKALEFLFPFEDETPRPAALKIQVQPMNRNCGEGRAQ